MLVVVEFAPHTQGSGVVVVVEPGARVVVVVDVVVVDVLVVVLATPQVLAVKSQRLLALLQVHLQVPTQGLTEGFGPGVVVEVEVVVGGFIWATVPVGSTTYKSPKMS